MVHLIKAACSSSQGPTGHWRAGIIGFHANLLSRYSPSMRERIDMDAIWRQAVRQAEAALDDHGETVDERLKAVCPFRLEDFTGRSTPPSSSPGHGAPGRPERASADSYGAS